MWNAAQKRARIELLRELGICTRCRRRKVTGRFVICLRCRKGEAARWRSMRPKRSTFSNLGGADYLILGAIDAGHHQVPGIARYAQVEPKAALAALNRLRRQGQVRRYGNTKCVRYVRVTPRTRRKGRS